jgi:hypothetical protein
LPRAGRRTFDTGLDFFEKLQRATQKVTPAEILTELLKGYRQLKRLNDAGSDSPGADKQTETPSEFPPGHGLSAGGENSPEEPTPPAARISDSPSVIGAAEGGSVESPELVTARGASSGGRSSLSTGQLHPLDLEYKRLRNQNMVERIETQKALRVRATNQALQETIQCPHCRLMLLRERAFEHIQSHNLPAVPQTVFKEDGRPIGPYCFKHGRIEPANSLCFPVSKEELRRELRGQPEPMISWK